MAARKKVTRKRKASTQKSAISGKSVLRWEFPASELHILRIEMFALIAFGIFVFWYMYNQFERQLFGGIMSVILFVSLYFVISAIVKRIHNVEEKYHLTNTHLEITRHVNGKKVAVEKVSLSNVALHAFDHFFLGAYVVSKGKRHAMFFNNEAESRAVHRHIKRKSKA